jgi:hypothetical protein
VNSRTPPRTKAATRKNMVSDVARGKSNVMIARLTARIPKKVHVMATATVSSADTLKRLVSDIQIAMATAARNEG